MTPPALQFQSCAVLIAGTFYVNLADGRNLIFPANLTPRLANATDRQRRHIEFLPYTLHWPEIDEDITVDSLIDLGYEAKGTTNSSQTALAA